MKAHWSKINVALFLIGLFLTGLVGTSTSMTFLWPAYAALGISGVFAIGLLFRESTFQLPKWSMLAVFALLLYLFLRAIDSPVLYFAREDVALAVASFLAYTGFLVACDSIKRRRAVVMTLAFLVVANAVFAVLQKSFGAGIWLLPGYERTSGTEVGGLFNQADHYAAFLGATVPIWLGMTVFSRDGNVFRKVYGCLAFVASAGMALAHSAVGWLVFFRRCRFFPAAVSLALLEPLQALGSVKGENSAYGGHFVRDGFDDDILGPPFWCLES